eukprot:5896299-Alexandrium_andersonii.AAC.1
MCIRDRVLVLGMPNARLLPNILRKPHRRPGPATRPGRLEQHQDLRPTLLNERKDPASRSSGRPRSGRYARR